MGRKSRTRTLNLWMNGAFVGKWIVTPAGEHQLYSQTSERSGAA